MIVTKVIKPKRIKDKAMRFALMNRMRKVGRLLIKEVKKTPSTWDHEVKVEMRVALTGPGPVVVVDTDDEIYRYVNDGTKPHEIWAGYYTGKSDKKALVFPWAGPGSYKAKTRPGVIGSGAGGPSGPLVAFPYVEHPGTEPRHFDKEIQRTFRPRFKREMEAAMREVRRVSGHAI